MVSSINAFSLQQVGQSNFQQQNQQQDTQISEGQEDAVAKSELERISPSIADSSESESQQQDNNAANSFQLSSEETENNPSARRGDLIDIAV